MSPEMVQIDERDLARLRESSDKLDVILIGLEKAGWPCRAVELPGKYEELARIVQEQADHIALLEKSPQRLSDEFAAEKAWKERWSKRACAMESLVRRAIALRSYPCSEAWDAWKVEAENKLKEG